MLRGFKALFDLSQPLHTGLWCLFTIAFFSFLRKSNLTVESSHLFDPTIHLTRQDIKFTTAGALLRIKWSKTIQNKERRLYIPLPSIPGSELCPIQATRDYLSKVPAPENSPFFCTVTSGIVKPISHYVFTKFLKDRITAIGLNPQDYSPHSFRRGGASFAFQAGVPERLIQQHGDWRSDVYLRYLTFSLSTRTQVADIMAANLLAAA